MVTVRAVEVVPWAIPLRAPLATARGTIAVRRGFVLVLAAERGLCGVGEAAPHPAAPPSALAATQAALACAAARLVGADAGDPGRLLATLAVADLPAASAIDVALHDLVGRASGRSVAELLGMRRAAVAVSALLDGDDLAAAAAAARRRGFDHAKLKVGPGVAAAVSRVAAAHAAGEPPLRLRADANGCWDAATAVRAAHALRPYGLDWLEQPVAAADVEGMARVRREAWVAVAADEAVTGPDAVARLADAGAADVAVLKLLQVGGLGAAMRTAATAAARGLDVTVTTSIDSGIGTAAARHLAHAVAGRLRPCGLATAGLLGGDIVGEPLAVAPLLGPPPGPGLGVTLDRARLARLREEAAA